jgi:2-methylisocitrate lyase-like PEP mutase family enzyme|tara:strand:- start:869 stop:1147 length:279 start_codon:yes stop_codon:yes gene_type:complete
MAQTVTECLSAGADSVALINGVNTDGASSVYTVGLANQTEINELVQRNVDHLETILAYTSTEDTPNIAGAASNLKTTHVAAVSTGKAYIAAN